VLATLVLGLLALAGPLAPRAAADKELPPNDGWVTDLAGMLTPEEEAALEAQMNSYEYDIALLTLPDLGGWSLEDLALNYGRKYKLGSSSNDGALLVVSRAERAIRIEVGRGLEGKLTDLMSGRIIDEVIAPRFQQGDYAGGLRAGIEAMQQVAGGKMLEPSGPSARHRAAGFLPFAIFLFFLFLALSRRGRGGGPRGRSRGNIWPWIIAANALGRGGRGGFSGGGFGGGGFGGGGFGGGGFRGFGGGGGFSGGGASGRW